GEAHTELPGVGWHRRSRRPALEYDTPGDGRAATEHDRDIRICITHGKPRHTDLLVSSLQRTDRTRPHGATLDLVLARSKSQLQRAVRFHRRAGTIGPDAHARDNGAHVHEAANRGTPTRRVSQWPGDAA